MAMAMRIYRWAWRAAGPLAALVVRRRDRARGVPAAQTLERFGWSARPGELRGGRSVGRPNLTDSLV